MTVNDTPEFDEYEAPLEGVEIDVPDEDEWDTDATPYDDLPEDEPQDGPTEDEAEPVGIRGFITPPSFVRTGHDAVQWALSRTSWSPPGMCQQFSRSAFNVGSFFPSAAAAWNGANRKHPTSNPLSIPRGVPVFWVGGSRGFGHVAVSLGNGMVRSTDWPSSGRVGTARITDISRSWNQRLVGWTEDINEVAIWEPDLPIVVAGNIARKTRRGESAPQALRIKKAVAAEVGKGSMQFTHSYLGGGFRKQYRLVQEKYLKSLGIDNPRASAADGVPGVNSLTWLGKRHGFNVKP